jgi:hypothetical protein
MCHQRKTNVLVITAYYKFCLVARKGSYHRMEKRVTEQMAEKEVLLQWRFCGDKEKEALRFVLLQSQRLPVGLFLQTWGMQKKGHWLYSLRYLSHLSASHQMEEGTSKAPAEKINNEWNNG